MARYNKKRNSAFVFKAITRQITELISESRLEEAQEIQSILKESFGGDSFMMKQYLLYEEVLKKDYDSREDVYQMLDECRDICNAWDKTRLFNEQTSLLGKLGNLEISPLDAFLEEYRVLANLHNLMEGNYKPGESSRLKESIADHLLENSKEDIVDGVDRLTLKVYVKNFKEEYSKKLLPEQYDILEKYIATHHDEKSFKFYLQEHIRSCLKRLDEVLAPEEVESDLLCEKLKEVKNVLLEGLGRTPTKQDILRTMKTYEIFEELEE